MAITGNFLQVVIRGLYNGQQWQVSPTYTATDVAGADALVSNFDWVRPSLVDWFQRWWNGDASVLEEGISDRLARLLPVGASVNEVRVFARTNVMTLPEQLVIVGDLNGARGSLGTVLPSYTALSCYARSLTYGRKGAAMRLPLLQEDDVTANEVVETTLDLFQSDLLDPLTDYASYCATETGLVVNTSAGTLVSVLELRPASVLRVPSIATGKMTFPYENPLLISAVECGPWSANPFASTQNSRKVGRGR